MTALKWDTYHYLDGKSYVAHAKCISYRIKPFGSVFILENSWHPSVRIDFWTLREAKDYAEEHWEGILDGPG